MLSGLGWFNALLENVVIGYLLSTNNWVLGGVIFLPGFICKQGIIIARAIHLHFKILEALWESAERKAIQEADLALHLFKLSLH